MNEKEKVKTLEAEIIGYQERISKLENALKEKDAKYNTIQADYNSLKEKIEIAKDKSTNDKSSYNDIKEVLLLRKENEGLNVKLLRFQNSLEENEKLLQQTREDFIDTLKRESESKDIIKNEFNQMKNELGEKLAELEIYKTSVNNLISIREKLENDLSLNKNELNQTKEDLNKKNKERENFKQVMLGMSEAIHTCENNVNVYKEINTELEDEILILKSKGTTYDVLHIRPAFEGPASIKIKRNSEDAIIIRLKGLSMDETIPIEEMSVTQVGEKMLKVSFTKNKKNCYELFESNAVEKMVQLHEKLKLLAQKEKNDNSGKSIREKRTELFSQINLMF